VWSTKKINLLRVLSPQNHRLNGPIRLARLPIHFSWQLLCFHLVRVYLDYYPRALHRYRSWFEGANFRCTGSQSVRGNRNERFRVLFSKHGVRQTFCRSRPCLQDRISRPNDRQLHQHAQINRQYSNVYSQKRGREDHDLASPELGPLLNARFVKILRCPLKFNFIYDVSSKVQTNAVPGRISKLIADSNSAIV